MKDIRRWLSDCTAKSTDNIGEEEALEALLEIQLLRKSKEPGAAQRILARLQVTIESHQVSIVYITIN